MILQTSRSSSLKKKIKVSLKLFSINVLQIRIQFNVVDIFLKANIYMKESKLQDLHISLYLNVYTLDEERITYKLRGGHHGELYKLRD